MSKAKAKAAFIAGADAFDAWHDDVLTGKAPVFYPVGAGELGRIEVGPGLVTLIGGAPGAGKTAFTMQCTIDALRFTPDLRALVCNIEMPPGVLLDRQLARLSGVDATTIRYRRIGAEHADRIDQGINTLNAIMDRICFVRPPFDLGNVAATADDFGASLLVLDYIQRIAPPGEHDNRRASVDATMNYLRQFADTGMAVIVVSAVARAKDGRGRSSYDGAGLNLASFKESSELEFGADDAFILHPDDDDAEGNLMTLRHLKSRHGECRDLSLRFNRRCQSFTADPGDAAPKGGGKPKHAAALAAHFGTGQRQQRKAATMNDAPIIPPGVVGLPPLEAARPATGRAAGKPKRTRGRPHTAERFAVLNAFLDLTAGTLSRAEALTWLILYRDTKAAGTAKTAQADIARRAGTNARTIRRALAKLSALGLVRIAWQGGFRKGPSVYAVAPLVKESPEGGKPCRR